MSDGAIGTLSLVTRWSRHRPGAVQGALSCARRSEPLTARTDDRTSGYQRKGFQFKCGPTRCSAMASFLPHRSTTFVVVFVWPGFYQGSQGIHQLLSVSARFEPSTTCAMRETSLVETAPSTESGAIHASPWRSAGVPTIRKTSSNAGPAIPRFIR
jgi:hypothetical protein